MGDVLQRCRLVRLDSHCGVHRQLVRLVEQDCVVAVWSLRQRCPAVLLDEVDHVCMWLSILLELPLRREERLKLREAQRLRRKQGFNQRTNLFHLLVKVSHIAVSQLAIKPKTTVTLPGDKVTDVVLYSEGICPVPGAHLLDQLPEQLHRHVRVLHAVFQHARMVDSKLCALRCGVLDQAKLDSLGSPVSLLLA